MDPADLNAPATLEAAAGPTGERRRFSTLLTAWGRVWSPLLTREEKRPSWEALGLPDGIDDLEPECWRVFHAALPAPLAPLLMHVLVATDGSQAREDWLRAIDHLHLTWNDRVLPPDHLATACEVVAAAAENDDDVLVRELLARYLEPWCLAATNRLAHQHPAAATLVACFRADLATVPR